VITNATGEFSDQSAEPAVNMTVRALNGTITDLSSKESERAELNLEGKVDGTGPVTIAGKLEPLRPKADTALKVSLRDMDLKPASGYVGKYAGYSLLRGKLNLDLDSGVSEDQLSTTNHVVLDQFTLGEKVDSPDATHLPVRLGVALLKDRSGKITLDLPIEGNLDDPLFGVKNAVAQVFSEAITKVTSSPFGALGAAFGGNGEELSDLEFAPGSAELQRSATKKLEDLVKGLYERPGLGVEIEGSVDPTTDGERVARQQPVSEYSDQKANSPPAEKRSRNRRNPKQASPTELEAAKESAVEAVAAQVDSARRAGNPPASGAAQAAKSAQGAGNANTAQGAAPGAARGVSSGEKLQASGPSAESVDDPLRQLARRRAERVKEYLLQVGKVDGERVFLAEESGAKVTTKGCRAYIQLR
jgi:hypothetical protein